jgi:GNAT superfamily N-acetyltransferase
MNRRKAPTNTLWIRPASLADLDTIVGFRLALLAEQSHHPIYGRLRDDARARARRSTPLHLASGREITYLAVQGRTPIGMLRCIEARGSALLVPARYAYIASTFVARTHRRRGVLRRLVDAAMVWARARGLSEFRVHSTPDNVQASAAWEKLGFPVVEVMRRREISRAPGSS